MTLAAEDLAVSRIAVLADGAVAEVVVTADHREARGRWHPPGGAWSPWTFVADGVDDISITADVGQQEGSALVSVVAWRPKPPGLLPQQHQAHGVAYYRLSESGCSRADDL